MNIERAIRLIAGLIVLVAAFLAWTVSPWFLALIAFVGINLVQSAFTNWCPMMTILRKAGVRDGSASARPVGRTA
jgi:hypothetical protein